jgi:hypothetical protein
MANISGGSPTAFERKIVASRFGASLNMRTLNKGGTSLLPGILYVDGPCVLSRPDVSHDNSSVVSHPLHKGALDLSKIERWIAVVVAPRAVVVAPRPVVVAPVRRRVY